MNKLGFGLLRLPKTEQPAPDHFDWPLLKQMTDACLAAGHTYFDTAYTYLDGWSEQAVRRLLVERHPRSAFRVADKLPIFQCESYDDCRRIFDEQLARCGVEYFDCYLLHAMNARNYAIAEKTEQFRFLRELKAAGLARRIGFSYHDSASLLDKILTEHPEVELVQLQINYLDWESEGVQSRRCYDVCVKHGKPVIVMEPVKGGTLANLPAEAEKILRALHPDWSSAAWALRFASSLPQVEVVLSGMNAMAQLTDNLTDFDPLTVEELAALEKAVAIINAKTAVPCTGCRYCETHCPQDLPIPDFFKMFNELSRYPDDKWKIKPSYRQAAIGRGKASDCIACGACAEACPQKLDIPNYMRGVAEALG